MKTTSRIVNECKHAEGLTCPNCGGHSVVRSGRRKNKAGVRQIWRCGDCWRRFSKLERGDKRTTADVVLRALSLYCEGYSLGETAFIIGHKYGVQRSRSCLCKWLKDFDPPYLQIRRMNQQARCVVRSHLFHHRKLSYEYQVHLPKLAFARRFGGLESFLRSLPDAIPDGVFEQGFRCSEHPNPAWPGEGTVRHFRHNWLSSQALQALRLARHNRERHAVLESYFLSCDRNTVATEVPIWFFDRQQGVTITGHIDLIQVNFGKVWVLDYKPRTAKENPLKVGTQLTLYARALCVSADDGGTVRSR